jgi:hypothetical protein
MTALIFKVTQRAKMACPLTESEGGVTFFRCTKWQFAARTSHAPKTGHNSGFDPLAKRQIIV